jgi:hypothetical protein
VLQVGHASQRRHLVDDRVRLRVCDRLPDGGAVEPVHDDRLGTEGAERVQLLSLRGRGDDLVSVLDQLWEQACTDCTACTCDKHPHRLLLSLDSTPKTRSGGRL